MRTRGDLLFVVAQVIVTVKKSSPVAQALKELMHREAAAIIREKLVEYLRCLKEGEFLFNQTLQTA